jgi:hypothetical protein
MVSAEFLEIWDKQIELRKKAEQYWEMGHFQLKKN